MNKRLFFIIGILLYATIASATESTQISTKQYLTPFYRASMQNNQPYTYTLDISPPDKVSSVVSAIISYDVYLTPTVTFTNTVNGQSCNNQNYTISTTYASAGQSRITFDCSNIIKKSGQYNITLKPTGANTGAVTGWIDYTYNNKPVADIEVHGTEYTGEQYAKLWVQLLNSTNQYVNNAVCEVDIYTPYNTALLERVQMTNLQHDGIYYYDIQTPNIEGVYPVIAQCYYQATTVPYYATNYTLYNATFNSGTFPETYTVDGNFMRFTEIIPSPRRLNMSLQFNNMSSCTQVSESFLTSLTVSLYSKFDSVVGDDLTISIYNYSNNRWVQLPNKKLESNAYDTTSNTITLNNITKAGFYNSTTQGVRLLFEDTALTDGANSNFDIDQVYVSCNQLLNPSWQEVRGSSEMHITNKEGYRYNVETLCNGEKPLSSSCELLYQPIMWDGVYLYEGTLFENITLSNPSLKSVTQSFIYETPSHIDCTAVINATLYTTGNVTSINDDIIYQHGNQDNCIMSIPVTFAFNQSSQYVELLFDNYLKWEVLRANDIRKAHQQTEQYCTDYLLSQNATIVYPLNMTLIESYNDSLTVYCGRFLDDLYFFDYYYDISLNITNIGEYESYHYEIAEYYSDKIEEQDVHITSYRNLIQPINASSVWNYPERNLTTTVLINDTQKLIDLNNTIYAQFANLQLNMTQSFNTINAMIQSMNASIAIMINLIPSQVWSYVTRDLTYYPNVNVTVNVSTQQVNVENVTINVTTQQVNVQNITVNVTSQIVSMQNITYNITVLNTTVNVQNVSFNITTQQVIVNNLTENVSAISDAVWNHTDRYTHGVILS